MARLSELERRLLSCEDETRVKACTKAEAGGGEADGRRAMLGCGTLVLLRGVLIFKRGVGVKRKVWRTSRSALTLEVGKSPTATRWRAELSAAWPSAIFWSFAIRRRAVVAGRSASGRASGEPSERHRVESAFPACGPGVRGRRTTARKGNLIECSAYHRAKAGTSGRRTARRFCDSKGLLSGNEGRRTDAIEDRRRIGRSAEPAQRAMAAQHARAKRPFCRGCLSPGPPRPFSFSLSAAAGVRPARREEGLA